MRVATGGGLLSRDRPFHATLCAVSRTGHCGAPDARPPGRVRGRIIVVVTHPGGLVLRRRLAVCPPLPSLLPSAPTLGLTGRVQEEVHRPVDVLITMDQCLKDVVIGILRQDACDFPDQLRQVAGLPGRIAVVVAFLVGITGVADVLTGVAR